MTKTLLFILQVFLSINFTNSQCLSKNDIFNSDKLFLYENKVYDITGYSHPGGKSTLLLTVGQDLAPFLQSKAYDFHLKKNSFFSDLSKMFVANICDSTTSTTSSSSPSESSSTPSASSSTPSSSISTTPSSSISTTPSSTTSSISTTPSITSSLPISDTTQFTITSTFEDSKVTSEFEAGSYSLSQKQIPLQMFNLFAIFFIILIIM